jgi:hypothetical protein
MIESIQHHLAFAAQVQAAAELILELVTFATM